MEVPMGIVQYTQKGIAQNFQALPLTEDLNGWSIANTMRALPKLEVHDPDLMEKLCTVRVHGTRALRPILGSLQRAPGCKAHRRRRHPRASSKNCILRATDLSVKLRCSTHVHPYFMGMHQSPGHSWQRLPIMVAI